MTHIVCVCASGCNIQFNKVTCDERERESIIISWEKYIFKLETIEVNPTDLNSDVPSIDSSAKNNNIDNWSADDALHITN